MRKMRLQQTRVAKGKENTVDHVEAEAADAKASEVRELRGIRLVLQD